MDELKEKVILLYANSRKEDVNHLTLGCFLDNDCKVNLCRHSEFDASNKTDDRCCPNYKNKCRFVLEAVLREVYGEENRVA